MKRLFKNHRLPENLEVLFMLVLGILLQMTDGSPFTIRERWMIVWETELPPEHFSLFVQKFIKTALSGIIIVRCVTTYAYVVSAMLVIFSILKKALKSHPTRKHKILSECQIYKTDYIDVGVIPDTPLKVWKVLCDLGMDTAPKLMLLWLVISGVKSVCMTFMEALTGVYVCSAFGKIRKACLEFFVSKALEINDDAAIHDISDIDGETHMNENSTMTRRNKPIFASYLWGSVLNIYHDMERRAKEFKETSLRDPTNFQKVNFRLNKPRSLIDQSTLFKTACLNNFEFKDVPQIILQMLRREEEMSQDSLLDPGMMLASVSNMGSFENLKTSQSLGELGFFDLKSVQVIGLDEDDNMTPPEKALRFLKLTWSDVRKAKKHKSEFLSEIFGLDNGVWNQVMNSTVQIHKPKQPRAEVFIKDIPQIESDEETEIFNRKARKRSFELKFGLSLFNLFQDNNSEKVNKTIERKSTVFSLEEDNEKEWEGEELFMSNIKDEIAVNRIRIEFVPKAMKGDAYANLYKQEYMSLIGPEVFDRACKLPKVTSLSKIFHQSEVLVSSGEPPFLLTEKKNKKKINFENHSAEDSELEIYSKSLIEEKEEQECNSLIDSFSKTEGETSVPEITHSEKERNKKSEKNKISYNKKYSEIYKKNEPKNKFTELVPFLKCFPEKKQKSEKIGFSIKVCPNHKKRKIIIKRTKRRVIKKNIIEFFNAGHKNFPFDSDNSNSNRSQSKSESDNEDTKSSEILDSKTSKSSSMCSSEEFECDLESDNENKQVCFLTELLQKPLADILVTYYDLKKGIHVSKKTNCFSPSIHRSIRNISRQKCERLLKSVWAERKRKKPKWKSKVLETVATFSSSESETESADIRKSTETMKTERSRYALLNRDLILGSYINGMKSKNIDFSDLILKNSSQSNDTPSLVFSDKKNFISAETTLDKSVPVILRNDKLVHCEFPVEEVIPKVSSQKLDAESVVISKSLNDNRDKDGFLKQKLECSTSYLGVDRNIIDKVSDFNTKIIKSSGKATTYQKEVFENETAVDSRTDPDMYPIFTEERLCDKDSDESFSLYYSKTADLASPLLDMKRFIYPDHIHYSYKHVKKRGFDVDITKGLPLLVRESLTMNSPSNVQKVIKNTGSEIKITRRPMDVSFARTNAFDEWDQRNEVMKLEKSKTSFPKKRTRCTEDQEDYFKSEKRNKNFRTRKHSEKVKFFEENKAQESCKSKCVHIKNLYSVKDYLLIAKLLETSWQKNHKLITFKNNRTPIRISSTQLHSNKGRIKSMYNPAIFLQENKTRSEKKKIETQEERTKDMFARLEREALWQNKNVQKPGGTSRD